MVVDGPARFTYRAELEVERRSTLAALVRVAFAFAMADADAVAPRWVVRVRDIASGLWVAEHRHVSGVEAESDLAAIEAALESLTVAEFEEAYSIRR